MLVGTETGDDAGVILVRDAGERGIGLVQTVDFITPLCDDPFVYGQIAAANSLSDVFAMGGRPISALNICVFPKELAPTAAQGILAGASQKIAEAGAALLGGHTVRGPELLFGLSVTGLVDPGRIWRNVGARPGDRLLLTKPLGAGLLATAYRRGLVLPEELAPWLAGLSMLNRRATEVLLRYPVSAATDVTGFGLCGHALGMTGRGDVSFHLRCQALPTYAGALRLAELGVTCGGAQNNQAAFLSQVQIDAAVLAAQRELVFDPQTSGGLLVALPADCADSALAALADDGVFAACIGEVSPRSSHPLLISP